MTTLMSRLPFVAAALVAVALAALSWSARSERAAAARDAEPPGQYALDGEVVEVAGRSTALGNGFPLNRDQMSGRDRPGSRLGAWLTPALVSGRNTAAIAVAPFLARVGDRVEPLPARFTVRVLGPDGAVVPGSERGVAASDSAFAAWRARLEARWPGWLAMEDSAYAADPALARAVADSVATDPNARVVGAGPALEAARAWAEAHPVVVETSFVRPGGARPTDGQPSFDGVFRGAPVIRGTAADSARLRDYAARLRDLLRRAPADSAAAEALYDEFGPAVSDSLGWFQVAPDPSRAAAVRTFRQEWGPTFDGGFGPSDVGLRSWSDGRVWELYRADRAALPLEPDGLLRVRDGTLQVFVAEVGGRLRVVRT